MKYIKEIKTNFNNWSKTFKVIFCIWILSIIALPVYQLSCGPFIYTDFMILILSYQNMIGILLLMTHIIDENENRQSDDR